MTQNSNSLKQQLLNINSWVYITLGLTIYFLTKELVAIGDFRIFYLAAEDIKQGKDIYKAFYLSGFHYFYNPLFATILSWFTVFPLENVAFVWKLVNLLAFYRLFYLLKAYLPSDSKKTINRVFLGAFAVCLAVFYKNIHNLQFNLFMLWAIFEALKLFKSENYLYGGLIIGFICSVKIIPITIVCYLIYRADFKAAIYSLLSILFFLMLPSFFIGHVYNLSLLESWWTLINPNNNKMMFDLTETQLASLTTWIPVLFTDSASADVNFSFRRHLMDLSKESVHYIINFCRIIMVVLSFYFLRSMPFQKENSSLKQLWEISYILIATVMIAPHQQVYAFVFIFPAVLYLTYYVSQSQRSLGLITLLILIGVFVSSEFYLGNFKRFYYYTKFLSIGTVLLTITLCIYTFNKKNKIQS